mmetsp:Transcript_8023/g.8170  ORF Transcript_8023/g.8170 Transcript_8023/m.8170 type:complete len:148 (-) Transcript_8023:51-494(-)
MSDSLVWDLIKFNHCFLHKQQKTKRLGAVQFSCEPGNLMSVNTLKYSGIANSKTIDLSTTKDNTIQMKLKATKKANKPSKHVFSTPLRKDKVVSLRTIKRAACSQFYRPDLTSAAVARYMRLYRDVRIKKGIEKAPRQKLGRKKRST